MGRTFYKILGVSICLFASACHKEAKTGSPSTTIGETPPVAGNERNVYIACEGAFGNGNASLYMQDQSTLITYENVYLNVNGSLLGDVFQSMERIDDQLFLCINNSDKVLILDANTRKYKGELSIPKPRYILKLNSEKAYVSSLYGNKVYVNNPRAGKIMG
ncbi:MAG: hypothetical protein KDC07_12520, partial [Chitinophagaceae bacterium]|nr:hypothetical protein [Chitinophagaceae bacterium]